MSVMSTIRILPDLLSWGRAADSLVVELVNARLVWVGRALAQQAPELFDTWSRFSDEAIERVLRAPVTCQAVRVGLDHIQFGSRLAAEHTLDSGSCAAVEAWSMLGNVWVGAATAHSDVPLVPLDCGHGYQGPALSCKIPVDFSVSETPEYPSGGLTNPGLYDRQAVHEVLRKLDDAMAMLHAVVPSAYSAVLAFTSNLVLRIDRNRPDELRSASSAATLGRTVLINAHFPQATCTALGEALVHEAVHVAVSILELSVPLVRQAVAIRSVVLRSPWTGDSLPLHAFLHACLVWFALARYWESVQRLRAPSSTDEARLAGIREGFCALSPEADLGPYREIGRAHV